MKHPGSARDEGQIAGVEGAVFGVLIFVIGSLLIANAWGVIDAKLATGSSAREAARAFVESRGPTSADALAEAERAAAEAMAGHGRDPSRMVVVAETATYARCGRAAFRVDYPVPLITIPLLGRFGRGFTASSHHAEIVDPYRSGLSARVQCPPEFDR